MQDSFRMGIDAHAFFAQKADQRNIEPVGHADRHAGGRGQSGEDLDAEYARFLNHLKTKSRRDDCQERFAGLVTVDQRPDCLVECIVPANVFGKCQEIFLKAE